MMGSSKYEYSPKQFDNDAEQNRLRFERKRESIKEMVLETLRSDPTRMKETYLVFIDCLRNIKVEYDL